MQERQESSSTLEEPRPVDRRRREGDPQASPTAGGDSTELSWPHVDRRKIPDRRKRRTQWWESLLGRRRRTRGRRKGESKNIYVDVYDQWDLVLLAAIFTLNLLDAVLTLVYLGHGGIEANPIMARVLGYGVHAFILEKCIVVGFCLLALIVHKTFTLAKVATLLLLGAYSLLTIYHVFLQLQLSAS